MIGIVVVSHSSKVAEGICDMVQQISSRDGEKLPIILQAVMHRAA